MQDQWAEVDWRDGQVPVSLRFDDPYYSLENGLEEARHVFLAGNNLPERFRDGFHIAELGFGTGLNFCAARELWQRSGGRGRFRYTTFEAYPLRTSDIKSALAAFPSVSRLIEPVLTALEQGAVFSEGADFQFVLVHGDANAALKTWADAADAWFLDGFSPAKNPELWGPDLLAEVGQHTRRRGTVATYTAAGHVRRSLKDAGFIVERRPGFGRKRHMTVARMPE